MFFPKSNWSSIESDYFMKSALDKYTQFLEFTISHNSLQSARLITTSPDFLTQVSFQTKKSIFDTKVYFFNRITSICQFILTFKFLDQPQETHQCILQIQKQLKLAKSELTSHNYKLQNDSNKNHVIYFSDLFPSTENYVFSDCEDSLGKTKQTENSKHKKVRKTKLSEKRIYNSVNSHIACIEILVRNKPNLGAIFQTYISKLKSS